MKAAELEEQAREYATTDITVGNGIPLINEELFLAYLAGAKSQQHLRDENDKLRAEIEILKMSSAEFVEKETEELLYEASKKRGW